MRTETDIFIKISGIIIFSKSKRKVKMQYIAPVAPDKLNLPTLNFNPSIFPAANKAKKSMQKFKRKTTSAYIICLKILTSLSVNLSEKGLSDYYYIRPRVKYMSFYNQNIIKSIA